MNKMDTTLHLRELEEELMSPAVRKDGDRLNELLADEFIEIGKSGKLYSKQSLIDTLKNEETTKIEGEDYQTTFITDTIVIIIYTANQYIGKYNKVYKTIRSSIWKSFKGSWKMIFHQGTPIKD